MRLLIEGGGDERVWLDAFVPSADRPRLPIPYSLGAAFVERGHRVDLVTGDDRPNQFSSCPGIERVAAGQFSKALRDCDVTILWAGAAVRAAVATALGGLGRKVLCASFVWDVPLAKGTRPWALALASRYVARLCRGVVFMTDEQSRQARRRIPRHIPIIPFTWGIDVPFYHHPAHLDDVDMACRDAIRDFVARPYFVLAGDQLRCDDDAIRLVRHQGIRLVRIPQESATRDRYRAAIDKYRLQDSLLVVHRATYPTLRFLLQHATAYLGLVDSTWQPAGWTVLCESIACGIRSVVYDGLAPREMLRLGADRWMRVVPHRCLDSVARACRDLDAERNRHENLADARQFAALALDLSVTAPAFVRGVESILA